MNIQKTLSIIFLSLGWMNLSQAGPITIINAGFEDISGQSQSNEFTFGLPAGWMTHDPNNITSGSGVLLGTLLPNGSVFFNSTAPEGNRVALLFGSSQFGQGAYGYIQNLSDTLQENAQYTLRVDVGNVASDIAQSGSFFNLDGFPGYRIELLAGGNVIASDNNTLIIPEAGFRTSTLSFNTDSNPALLGQVLGIRLVNLNQIPAGYTPADSPDLEVDFDNVRLDVVITPLTPPAARAPILNFEEPIDGRTSNGIANVRGWVVSDTAVTRIDLYVDGVLLGAIPHGGSRPLVGDVHSTFPNSDQSGFSMAYGFSNLSPGGHTMEVRVFDGLGQIAEQTNSFFVAALDSAFIGPLAPINLSGVSFIRPEPGDSTTFLKRFRMNNAVLDGVTYDLLFEWNSATQKFEMIDVF